MKEITLTRGRIAKVSDEDYDYLNQFKWYYDTPNGGRTGYACRTNWQLRKNERMHSVILKRMGFKIEPGFASDHIDRDGLNNQRENLRVISSKDNSKNSERILNATGVYYNSHCKNRPYVAQLMVNYRKVFCEFYATEDEAKMAYKFAKQLFIIG
jgi:hypothetical protein